MYNKKCADLKKTSENNEIKETAFELLTEIRNVALATLNKNIPSVRIVVIAYIKDDNIYIMTARGKPMYRQLIKTPYVSIVGKCEEDIMVRVEGEIKILEDKSLLLNLIKGFEGMYTGKTDILEMFYINSGTGEIFDLTEEHPTRLQFYFGDSEIKKPRYQISDKCVGCETCWDICVTGAIIGGNYNIDQYLCVNCGRCEIYCPNNAINYIE